VDDDVSAIKLLTTQLGQDGYRVLAAKSAAEGFENLAKCPVHVVLCAPLMPEMNGIEFLSRIKVLYPETMRIVISNADDSTAVLEAINRGAAYRYFTKPWTGGSLRADIREVFNHYWRLHGRMRSPWGAAHSSEKLAKPGVAPAGA